MPSPKPAKATESPAPSTAIEVVGLGHRYGSRQALAGLDLTIAAGELFAVLGPNGGGKTTLFRILSTLIPLQTGSVNIAGCNLAQQPAEVRARIGVVFHAPSLDR
jgi:ABC-2 type transport system ATP-binding protein